MESFRHWPPKQRAPYPVFSSVLDVETVLSNLPEVEVTPDVEAANDVVDDDVDFLFVVSRHLSDFFSRRRLARKKPDTGIFQSSTIDLLVRL